MEDCSRDLYSSVEGLTIHIGNQDAIVGEAGNKVDALAADAVQVAESARVLAESSTCIRSVVEVIQQISDQTNLLALNAAVEAARAGEIGSDIAASAGRIGEVAKKIDQQSLDVEAVSGTLSKI